MDELRLKFRDCLDELITLIVGEYVKTLGNSLPIPQVIIEELGTQLFAILRTVEAVNQINKGSITVLEETRFYELVQQMQTPIVDTFCDEFKETCEDLLTEFVHHLGEKQC